MIIRMDVVPSDLQHHYKSHPNSSSVKDSHTLPYASRPQYEYKAPCIADLIPDLGLLFTNHCQRITNYRPADERG